MDATQVTAFLGGIDFAPVIVGIIGVGTALLGPKLAKIAVRLMLGMLGRA